MRLTADTSKHKRSFRSISALLLGLALAGCSIPFTHRAQAGVVEFGTDFNGQFQILNPTTAFHAHQTVAWVAHLSSPAGSGQLTREVLRLSGNHGGKVFSRTVRITDLGDNLLGLKISPAQLDAEGVTVPGTYEVRYLRGGRELAKGSFSRLK